MKKTKKLLALALALMLSLSCMAMPAMAMENGSARVSMICGGCKSYQNFSYGSSDLRWETRYVGGCENTNLTHQHTTYYRDRYQACDNCGHRINEYRDVDHVVCNY